MDFRINNVIFNFSLLSEYDLIDVDFLTGELNSSDADEILCSFSDKLEAIDAQKYSFDGTIAKFDTKKLLTFTEDIDTLNDNNADTIVSEDGDGGNQNSSCIDLVDSSDTEEIDTSKNSEPIATMIMKRILE